MWPIYKGDSSLSAGAGRGTGQTGVGEVGMRAYSTPAAQAQPLRSALWALAACRLNAFQCSFIQNVEEGRGAKQIEDVRLWHVRARDSYVWFGA